MANTANLQSLSVAEIIATIGNTVSNSTLKTDFNVTPYYDDYRDDKQFYRILYKPGYAVQARELTQSQTIAQKQIERFGKHIFNEGSIVVPGQFGIQTNLDYVKIKNNDTANNAVDVSKFLNQVIVGQTNGIQAYVIDIADGNQNEENTKTLFLRYASGASSITGSNSSVSLFTNNEILVANGGSFTAVSVDSSAVGTGSRFVITEGVVFAKSHFVYFPTSSVVLSRYDNTPTCRVGFNIEEQIITAENDISLLDPALESSNYAAPGADRLKLIPTLSVVDIDDTTGRPDFVELFTIKEGIITQRFDRPQYNILKDELAKRTMDESGDYYVNGMSVRVRENRISGDNEGLLISGDKNLLSIGVEPGTAYVKGYEVSILGQTRYIETEKSNTYGNVTSQITSASMGDYLEVKEFVGFVNQGQDNTIFLKDRINQRISNGVGAAATGVGNTLGTAKVLSIEYDSGLLGTPSGVVAVYLTDIKMNGTNSFADVKSISSTGFGGDLVLGADDKAVLKDVSNRVMLYYTGTQATKTVRTTAGAGSVDFEFKRTADISLDAQGLGSITIPVVAGETLPYGTTSDLPNADRRDIILNVLSSINVKGQGTVSGTAGSTTLTGSGAFFNRLNNGDQIEINGKTNTFVISTITDDNTLTITSALPNGISGNVWYKAYEDGDVIDLTSDAFDNGVERTVEVNPTTISINVKESFGGSGISGKISYRVARASAEEATKTLNASRYVMINCAAANGSTTGPFSLGFPDLYRVRKILKRTSTFPTSNTDTSATDVTSNFIINNGQRDNQYDLASITPKSTLTATDRLLVELDYFTYTPGKGFFSVDSYPVDDTTTPLPSNKIRIENIPVYTSPTSGNKYDLRNYIDFRPVKAASATDTTTPASGSVNPSNTTAFQTEANGMRIVAPSSRLDFDYSYYNARRDLIVIDKDGNLAVINGVASPSPITPATSDNVMDLANIYIPPYPSLATNYARKINRRELGCVVKKLSNLRYTMRDIGVLQRRIENLEYYAALSLLEKAAIDLRVLDQNGNDRFKNGIFVDNFVNHDLGLTESSDYRIVVDPYEKSIRPIFTQGSSYFNMLTYPTSQNVQRTGDLVTLPYTEALLLEQPRATSYRNVEYTSYRFIGNMRLVPETDNWIDIEKAPDEQVTIGPDGNNLPQGAISTTWNSWQTIVTGYIIAPSGQNSANPGSYTPEQYAALTYNGRFNGGASVKGNLITAPDSPNDQAVTQSTSYVRTGTEVYATGITESSESVGSKIVDVSQKTYIRPQTILVTGVGLKANTQHYVFFDGEDMNQYAKVYSPSFLSQSVSTSALLSNFRIDSSSYTGNYIAKSGEVALFNDQTEPLRSYAASAVLPDRAPVLTGSTFNDPAEGAQPIVSDSKGNLYFSLRLPSEKPFRNGSKQIDITDSPTNSMQDATSYAKGYFLAQGLTLTKQNTILTTRELIYEEKTLTESNTTSAVIGYVNNPSCSAYSFLPKAPDGEEGVFLTSVDLFFAKKHPTLGVWIEIREMNSAGGITRNQVPLSEVWKTTEELNTSDDASTATNFKFQSPIFLYSNVQYAFVIHTIGLNPDTYFWVSRVGETDITTGTQVNGRPLTGTFYTTNNNLNWNIVEGLDLKIKFYRASFDTAVTGDLVIGNRPVEKLIIGNVSTSFNRTGERIFGRSNLTLTGATSTINIGDHLIGNVSRANASVVGNTSLFTVANNKFVVGERVDIFSNSMVSRGTTANISSISTAGGILSLYKVKDGVALLEISSSNGLFFKGDVITGESSGTKATVDGIQNFRYSVIDFEPAYLRFNKTAINFRVSAASNSGTSRSYENIYDSSNYYFEEEKAIFSKSNEISTLSGDKSVKFKATMSTSTNFMSPVIDLARTHMVYIDNLINANTTGEANTTSGGGLTNRYISRTITLAEGQDAEDVSVILTAYRPPTTDVKVYIKLLNGEDASAFSSSPWMELDKVEGSEDLYSSASNRNDFKEYIYELPTWRLTANNQVVQYTNSAGVQFTGFKYYAIKIGLTGTNSAIVPKVGDLRVLALQK
jgi:hypothetical protein